MNYRTLIVTLLMLCVSLVAASQTKSGIDGEIADSEGAVIANARVLLHWDSAGSTVGLSDNIGIPHDVIVMTDHNGRYLAEVPAGFYDVFVSAMAFTPTAAKVRVKKGSPYYIQHDTQTGSAGLPGIGALKRIEKSQPFKLQVKPGFFAACQRNEIRSELFSLFRYGF